MPESDVVDDPELVIECVRQPPVLITEGAVAFSTAAAVPLPRTKPTRRVIGAYPPRRDAFLEQAATAREMQRL